MNAIIRDGPAGGAVVEVPQPPPETLSVEVRPEVPEGPIRPGDEFPTVSGPAHGYRLSQPVGMVGTQIGNDPGTATWMAFYGYDEGANAELAEHAVSVHELELDIDRDWDIIDGPIEVGSEGHDSSVFRYRYRRGDVEKTATVTLSGTAMASPEGLESHIAEMVWSLGASALIAALRKGRTPEAITVYSDGRIIEAP
ncbi:MAG: hypothetical protein ABSB69_02270 [Solirubrobacteraceae bacterium]